MELLKPIIVKRWISENKYIKYIFDNNIGNKYKSDDIVINQYIFQDNNIKDALNKIAYHIYNYENNSRKQQPSQLTFPYYCWDETLGKPFLFDIKEIYWKGYDVNPMKSKDRASKKLEESIEYINNDNDELFNNDLINIVFRNDFDYDNKYYFNKNEEVNVEAIAKLIKEEDSIVKLYNIPVLKVVEQNEYYNEVIFEYRMENIEPLMVLFDTLKTDEEIQLIQFANNNNAIYKLYKYHTFDKKYLDYRFKSSSTKKEGKDISVINLYYKNKNIKLSIFKDGVFKLAFKYDVDNGENKSNILHIKDDIVKYLKKFNINIFFKEIDINLRINYSIDNLEYQKLIKKIGTYTKIFEDFVLNKKKSKGVFKYKRIAGNSMRFDLDNFIINRHEIQDSTIEEILAVLKDMGINTTINYIKGVINKKAEIQNIKPNNTDTDEKEETIIIIKEYNNNIDFYVDIKKTSSFVELDNLKYWLSHIIEDIRNERKPGPGPKKKIITNIVLPEPKKASSKSSSKSPSSKKSSSKSSDSFKFDEEEFNKDNFNNRSSGGDKNSKNDNNYLINKLNNADKELYKDRGKGKNPARKCQKEYQPLVLKKEEIEMLKSKGYDPYDKKVFDNYIEYGSSEDNKNFYTCPRVWCPISNIPLDEAPSVPGESLKCPEENEKPIMMNANMKNENKSRFVYLLKGDIEIPCCGKRNPEKNANLVDSKKIDKLPSKKAIKDLEKKKKADNKNKKKKEIEEIEQENDDIVYIPESPGAPKTNGTRDNGSDENDKNYIMNKIPVPKNRFGGIQKELYYILFDDYKDYTKNCLSNNNINKHNCVLRKGLNNTTNIINSIAYLLGITKEDFIKNIEDKLDILKFLSLENGNVFKDFSDIEPVIPELNKELYTEFLLKYANADKTINIPDMNDNREKSLYQKSRLLCIYKSYKKFINYLKTEENPSGNVIHYLYTLVAIIYNKLIVLWDVEIGQPNSDVSIVCPRYCAINDLLLYLGKKTKVIMLMTSSENKAKDNEVAYYEPIISKSLNKKESLFFNLDNHKNIVKILNKCSVNISDANKNFYTNLENMKATRQQIIIKTEGQKDDVEKNQIYRTLIINKDLSINRIILKKDNTVLCIIKFEKLSIIMLDLIIKRLNIKDVLFSEDIDGDNFKIYINKALHSFIVKRFEKIGIAVDIGEIAKENENTIRSNLLFKDEAYSKDRGIISNILNKYNDTGKYSKEEKKWQDMRKHIYDKLLDARFDDNYYNELSKKSRKEIIKILLNNIGSSGSGSSGSSGANKRKLRGLQIILEGIDIYSRKNIKDWYSNDLAYSRYNYVHDISNNIKEDGDDLIFTQYFVSDRVPDKITNNGDYLPNTNTNAYANTNIGFYELKNNLQKSKSSDNSDMQNGKKNQYQYIPENWKGIEKVLARKWTKYKKKIWSKLRYIDSTYTDTNIYELFKYLLKYDNNLINNIITFEDIVQYTYKEYMDLLLNNTPDIDLDYKNEIDMLFKDPHFKNTYITAMNIVNNTNKTFKTTRIFLEDYFYKSSPDERKNILNIIESTKAIKYYGDILLKQMSINLNINIMVIHHRVDYGKGVEVSKRAGSKDLKVSIKFYNAGDNNNHTEILKRPLIILYRKIEKTFVGYYLIKLIDDNKIIYNELNEADEDIKNILKHPNSLDKSSSPITVNI